MSELAVAAYAAARDLHLVSRPEEAGYREFVSRFDATRYRVDLERRGLRWLARSDEGFPPLLRAIHDPPVGLFLRGRADSGVLGMSAVGVVGARACSPYGSAVARMLGRELAAAGAVVVSGLARGVDAEAHRGALDAGGITVTVLGCGVDRDYPATHADLARRVAERGLIVSEYAPGVEPAPWRFPARNRIIAGLSSAVVIVEARERSGALITADFALEEGRDVFAVPGEITSMLSVGTNRLLGLGAAPLTQASDVLTTLDLPPPAPATGHVSEEARRTLAGLEGGAMSADDLVRSTGLAPSEVAVALSELELGGLVFEAAGFYRRGPP